MDNRKVNNEIGQSIYDLACELFPICRSITGEGIRKTLSIIKRELPELIINEVPTGTICFDWEVPREWRIKDAYIIDPDGNRIAEFKNSNLHIVHYSIAVNKTISLEELQEHLHSLPEQPDAIPYITSFYEERWGFCITHEQREKLKHGMYHVYIDSELFNGNLSYGELILEGKSKKEIFVSTYCCHPSLANNELSGPTVTTYLVKWLKSLKQRRYTYRIIFIPETIGSIVYISRNLDIMRSNIIAGFNINCCGDEREYSYLPSRFGNTLADKVALHSMSHLISDFKKYSFMDRESDERQYCSPGVDLPVVSIMRSKYGSYPEYHTSKDDLTLITPDGLYGTYNLLIHCFQALEYNEVLQNTVLCEPQLGRRKLMSTLGTKFKIADVKTLKNILAFSDGSIDLLEISEIIHKPIWEIYDIVNLLKSENLLKSIEL